MVVTASRREEQLLNAPATMTVLTEDLLATAPGQGVTDLLRLAILIAMPKLATWLPSAM